LLVFILVNEEDSELIKKSATQRVTLLKSGVGGFRTLVQTTNNLAFYMLIL